MRVPKRRSEELRKHHSGSRYLTAEAIVRLKEELQRCERDLPALIAEVMRTKENGDLSENFEYQDAKRRLRQAHSYIAGIKHRLVMAVVIPKKEKTSGRVELGSLVTLEVDSRRVVYTILGSYESKPEEGKISDRSPLGTALLGRSKGDAVTIVTARGEKEYRIVDIQ